MEEDCWLSGRLEAKILKDPSSFLFSSQRKGGTHQTQEPESPLRGREKLPEDRELKHLRKQTNLGRSSGPSHKQ